MRKGVNPYKYMNDWEKFDKTSLREKEDFYSHLNMEDIIDADNRHAKRVCQPWQTALKKEKIDRLTDIVCYQW